MDKPSENENAVRFPEPERPACWCKSMERYSNEGEYPIKYDDDHEQYVLVSRDESKVAFIYYCFHCGGRVFEPAELKDRPDGDL